MPITSNEDYRLRILAKKVNTCNSVLDIGCAQLPNKFLKNNTVTGLDLNQAELPLNYSTFIKGSLDDVIKMQKTFDAIVAGEILEHLLDPMHFLQQCNQALKPGGILAISTPNPHSIIEVLLTMTLNRKYFYTKDHVMLFPQRWLIRMLEIKGFTGIKLYSAGFPIPKYGLIPFPRFLCHQTIAIATKAMV
ncbi:class I SAM-dependent methyltransferase [Colwellia sp. 12G3]|uniref:class I SAM-dependent methyltransferase n=1 Tax=Colwellia sp. 12G3 TaxID=2058299 RepID=UPI0012FEC14B|nr:class I SAM-dependent methyltransferase [Colwellia sp. 12G3]